MYILMIARGYPTPDDPQWGCFEKDQADALAALGHKVVVMSVDSRFRFKRRKHGVTHHLDNSVNYYNLYCCPALFYSFLGKFLSLKIGQWQMLYLFKKIIKKHGLPHVIYSHFFGCTAMGVKLKEKYNISLVGIEHAARFNEDVLDSSTLYGARYAYTHTDMTIVVAETLRESLYRHFKLETKVVHNMANQRFFTGRVYPDRKEKLSFVATGSLIYRKGYDVLIAACEKMNISREKWELKIIGGGEEKENLQEQINRANLQKNIHLVGQKDKEDIIELLINSNVFVLPSRNENFSVAVLEALACGLPVIASICGGIRECIDEKNGLLFPVDDVDALANALQYMIESYDKYNRQSIAADCKNRFSPEVIAKQLTTVFEEAIEKHNHK